MQRIEPARAQPSAFRIRAQRRILPRMRQALTVPALFYLKSLCRVPFAMVGNTRPEQVRHKPRLCVPGAPRNKRAPFKRCPFVGYREQRELSWRKAAHLKTAPRRSDAPPRGGSFSVRIFNGWARRSRRRRQRARGRCRPKQTPQAACRCCIRCRICAASDSRARRSSCPRAVRARTGRQWRTR